MLTSIPVDWRPVSPRASLYTCSAVYRTIELRSCATRGTKTGDCRKVMQAAMLSNAVQAHATELLQVNGASAASRSVGHPQAGRVGKIQVGGK